MPSEKFKQKYQVRLNRESACLRKSFKQTHFFCKADSQCEKTIQVEQTPQIKRHAVVWSLKAFDSWKYQRKSFWWSS